MESKAKKKTAIIHSDFRRWEVECVQYERKIVNGCMVKDEDTHDY